MKHSVKKKRLTTILLIKPTQIPIQRIDFSIPVYHLFLETIYRKYYKYQIYQEYRISENTVNTDYIYIVKNNQ